MHASECYLKDRIDKALNLMSFYNINITVKSNSLKSESRHGQAQNMHIKK